MAKAAESTSRSRPRRAVAKTAAKADANAGPAKPRTRASSRKSDKAVVDRLVELLQSPLVSDLLAVGAMAAVASIAEQMTRDGEGRDNKRAVKAAAKAAASAIGARLLAEFRPKAAATKA